jgi:uncharacterized iron-regulated membrane protein
VHRWIGLGLAAIVLVVAASGGLLLFRDPYYRAVYPSLNAPITPDLVIPHADVLTAIESRWRTEHVRLVKFPRAGMNAFQVWLDDGTEAFVNPQDGTVIDRWHWFDRLPAFLFELHAHLLAEPSGTWINGLAALCLVFMALTGLLLWWPARRGRFRLGGVIPRRVSPGDLLRSHAAVGAIAALPIVLFAGTGAAIVFYEPTARAMSRLLDARPPQEPNARVLPRKASVRPWTTILSALDGALPDGQTVFYYPGTPDNARLMFRKRLEGEWHPNGRSYIVIDPYTADVVQAIDARAQGVGTRIMHAIYPVHAAKVGGPAMVTLAGFAAAALTWLTTGGTWAYVGRRFVWLRKRGRESLQATKVMAPDAR